MLGANITVDRGELDLIGMDGDDRVAFEVRTITGEGDPIDAVDQAKRRQVQRLAAANGASRVDLVGIRLHDDGFDVHWVPGSD